MSKVECHICKKEINTDMSANGKEQLMNVDGVDVWAYVMLCDINERYIDVCSDCMLKALNQYVKT